MYFVRSVDHPGAAVSGQRAHVVIAGFVAKYSPPILRPTSTNCNTLPHAPRRRHLAQLCSIFAQCQNDQPVVHIPDRPQRCAREPQRRLQAARRHRTRHHRTHTPTFCAGYMPHWLTYYITDGMEETMLRICSESERLGSEDSAASVLQQRLSRKGAGAATDAATPSSPRGSSSG